MRTGGGRGRKRGQGGLASESLVPYFTGYGHLSRTVPPTVCTEFVANLVAQVLQCTALYSGQRDCPVEHHKRIACAEYLTFLLSFPEDLAVIPISHAHSIW